MGASSQLPVEGERWMDHGRSHWAASCDPAPLRKVPVWQGGSRAAATHTGNDRDPRSPILTIASVQGFPLLSSWGGSGPGSAAAAEKGPLQPISTEAAFISLVTGGGSVWGLFVSFFSLGCCYYPVQYLIFP